MAEPYLERLTETISNLDISLSDGVLIECRHFFSGAALFANRKICITLTPVGFGLKLPDETRSRMIAVGDGKELRYFDNGPIKKEYVSLSQSVLDDPDRFEILIRQSIEYVISKG